MTEKPRTSVSMQKSSADGAAKPPPERPRTIVAMVVLLVAAGLAAVGASIALFGAKDYLYNNAIKDHLVLTNAEVQTQQGALRTHLTKDLTDNPQLSDTAIAARANSVQQFVQNSLQKVQHYNASDASDQATKMHDATNSALQGVSGTRLSNAQIQTQVKSLTTTYKSNLQAITFDKIRSSVNSAPKQYVIINLILLLALLFVAAGAWRGRYWSRWAVIGLYVLATLGGSFAGINSIFYIGVSLPGAFKTPVVLAGLFFLAAVIMAFLRPSARYYAELRPAGMPQRRGLFAPRVPPVQRDKTVPTASTKAASSASPAASGAATPSSESRFAGADRSKAKQRASAEAVAKGAELARSRAKAASKSRRSGS